VVPRSVGVEEELLLVDPDSGRAMAVAAAVLRNAAGILLIAAIMVATGSTSRKPPIPGLDETKTEFGWAGGLGMEVGFAPNWSAKVEYLYMDLGDDARHGRLRPHRVRL